jgi:hypothetical protein
MKTALDDAPGPEQPSAAPLEFPRARRSPRKPAFVRVWLRRETGDRIWEEDTQTQMLSRHGAAIECRHAVQTGEVLAIIRRDNGKRVNARVAYSKYSPSGDREIGVELLDNENFWNVNWSNPDLVPPPGARSQRTIDVPANKAAVPEQPSSRYTEQLPESERAGAARAPEMKPAQSETQEPAPRRAQDPHDAVAAHVLAQQRRVWRAVQEKDPATLRSLLSEDLLWISRAGADGNRIDFENYVRREWTGRTQPEFEFIRINKTAAIVTFATPSGDASSDSKSSESRAANPVYHSSVWMRRGGKWWIVFHQQTQAD